MCKVVREEERLTAVVDAISHDVTIVPRGAYIKNPQEVVLQNKSFRGWSLNRDRQTDRQTDRQKEG